jgi:hypothetical protein
MIELFKSGGLPKEASHIHALPARTEIASQSSFAACVHLRLKKRIKQKTPKSVSGLRGLVSNAGLHSSSSPGTCAAMINHAVAVQAGANAKTRIKARNLSLRLHRAGRR